MVDRWIQDVVNAQVEVNRAVFLANVALGGIVDARKHMDPESYSEKAIGNHIDLAIKDLQKAKEGLNEYLEASCKKQA